MGIVTLAVIAAVLILASAALWWQPPDLIRVAANYTAKTVCSNVFLAGRDPDEVLRSDVQAPGNPLLRLMRVTVDRDERVVRAGLLGFIGEGLAALRPGQGCAALPDGTLPSTNFARGGPPLTTLSANGTREYALWPEGDAVRTEAPLERMLANDHLAGPGMRAIVVVHDGRIVAERYADGFGPMTPQLGWSMTKSVTAGLIGILVNDGGVTLSQPVGSLFGWSANDPRAPITLADLMAMSSGLEFNEAYGAVSDVTRMLYLEPDMAGFAGAQPLAHPIHSVWNYSSGSAILAARVFQDAAGTDAVNFVRQRLFEPLGMSSAIMETDERGTLVGSSYLYATPRDWARYGLLLAQDGLWQGREILPRGYVSMMSAPVSASGGQYGQGMVWRWAMDARTPGVNPDVAFGLPPDSFWMLGYEGQYIDIIPSKHLVIVRMGLTPSRDPYDPEALVKAILEALGAGPGV